MLDYYNTPMVRTICHKVKDGNQKYIREMANYLSQFVNPGSAIIPIPQHTGRAEYTKEIADIVCEIAGAVVCDVLACDPRPTRYEAKYHNYWLDPGLRLIGEVPNHNSVYVLDNVIGTGATMRNALDVLGKGKPLVYVCDFEN